jgi:hypothetical protein
VKPVKTGDRGRSEGLCRPLARAGRSFDQLTQGSASLHPGLYAFARLGGLIEWFRIWLRPARAMLPRRLAGELICEKVQTQSLQSQRRENHFSERLLKPGVNENHD